MKPVRFIVAGAGGRGTGYATYATHHPELAELVGVAEPRDLPRMRLAAEHDIPPDNLFVDWKEAAAREKFADAVVITTQDAMHTEPAIAFAEKGYHLLLEKPMAPTADECRRIVDAVKANGVMLAVGHVMLYTPYTQALKRVLNEGAIGEIVSIQHLEPVGYWHQAHSFVRGNWRNEAESSFMLLAKSCHDIDWLRYIMGERCQSVSSFGTLKHFRQAEKPAAAGDALRCTACAYEPACPYSAKKLYLGNLAKGKNGWPVNVLTFDLTEAGVLQALETGPYGRCVYECDNDVVDTQVVNLEFAGGKTASFTMTAFAMAGHRRTSIFGTRGEIYGNGVEIRVTDFLTDQTRVIDTTATDASILGGHGGGDLGLMGSFINAVASNDASGLLSGPDETLESHLMVFAAEQARREHRVVDLR
ncbi:MAG: Gfo/Idh/MocA family oxidoreductase [Caldilineaceae bacterium]|nr:Gfo/Idh/MocA family oxidoreductase [Caldilineaceae bacterium]